MPCLATLVVDFSEVTSEVLNTLLLFLYFNFLSSLKFIDLFNFDVIFVIILVVIVGNIPNGLFYPYFFTLVLELS